MPAVDGGTAESCDGTGEAVPKLLRLSGLVPTWHEVGSACAMRNETDVRILLCFEKSARKKRFA